MKAINDAHESEYEVAPDVVAKAPGRFHLIGEHSGFFRDKTLSMTINLSVHIAVSRRSDSVLRFYFVQLNDRKKANLSSLKLKKEDKWANALKSVIYGFVSSGFNLGGMNITVYSDVLPSAGFGITTAIKAASALAIRKLFNLTCTDMELLSVIEKGNKNFLQLQLENHLADNYAALFAKKDNFILTDYSKNTWEYIPVQFLFDGRSVYLTDTKVPRVTVWNEETLFEPKNALLLGDLRETKPNVFGGWAYINNPTDINEVLSEVSEDVRRKLLCVIYEHGNVVSAVEALQKHDFFKFARSVNSSHESLRELYNLSCPETDWILKRINEIDPNLENIRNPVSCGRITGKGFGRCLYSILRDSDIEKFQQKLQEFEKIFGFHPECYRVETADGACIVS